MFGKDALIKLGLNLLKKFMAENNAKVEFTENQINDWLAVHKHPYSLLCITDPEKGKIIKIIYSGE